jgi:hypothetical protein
MLRQLWSLNSLWQLSQEDSVHNQTKPTCATTTTKKPNIPSMQTSETNPSPTTKQPAKTTPKIKCDKIHKQKDVAPKKPTTTQVEQNKRTLETKGGFYLNSISFWYVVINEEHFFIFLFSYLFSLKIFKTTYSY